MPTGTVLLTPGAAVLPDASSGNAAPAKQRVKSSAAAPAIHFLQLAFDGATDEMCQWSFRAPVDYASGPVLKVQWKTSVTTGTVRWEGRVAAYTPTTDTTSLDAKALDTTNSAGTAVPATTAQRVVETSITLTNADSLAAGDWVTIYLRRDADGTTGTDDVTADVLLVAASLEYTTT